jgi:hypothetical protein
MYQLYALGQKAVETVLYNRMGLAAANLHDHPGTGLHAAYFPHHVGGDRPAAVFIDKSHGSP